MATCPATANPERPSGLFFPAASAFAPAEVRERLLASVNLWFWQNRQKRTDVRTWQNIKDWSELVARDKHGSKRSGGFQKSEDGRREEKKNRRNYKIKHNWRNSTTASWHAEYLRKITVGLYKWTENIHCKALTMEVNGSKYRRLFLLKIWHLFIFILFLFNMTAVRKDFEWHSILYSLLYCLYEEIFYLLPIKLLHVLQIIIWII